MPRYSVIVPVYNEGANIAKLCRRALDELPPDYELLICYDFAADNTLPALASIPPDEKPPNIRLVLNTLGRGVRYAIEAGMRAAQTPIVIVTMADLSDSLTSVPAMLEKAESGAAVVAGSRYMEGGAQFGGPMLKGLMSRMAGLSLYHIAGIATHDATNSFKSYRKDFLDTVTIESQAGFALGIELTVKAHLKGLKITEVPATWTDRSAGESRFKLVAWLPMYFRWYFIALRSGR
jgi:dolichol-phosphate mannosyltransferase